MPNISVKEAEILAKQKRGQEASARDLKELADSQKRAEGAQSYGLTGSKFGGTPPEVTSSTSTSELGSDEHVSRANHVHGQGTHTHADDTTGGTIASTSVSDFAEAVDDRVDALIVDGEGIDTTYDDPNGTLTIAGEDASDTNKGIASFAAADFDVATGAVSLEDTVVKSITTDVNPATPSTHAFSIVGGEGIDVTGATSVVTVAGEIASDTNKGVASFDETDFTVTAGDVAITVERIQDIVGAMVTGNTETNIAVTYEDADGTLDFVVTPPAIADESVTFAKMQHIGTQKILGKQSAGDGDIEQLSLLGSGGISISWATGAAATVTIADGAITIAKLENISSDKLLGRDLDGSGGVERIGVGGGIEFTGTSALQTSAFTGDVSKSAGGTSLTIGDEKVTYAKMQHVSATDKILGRKTAGAGDVEEIDCTAAGRALLDDANAAAQLVTLGITTNNGWQALGSTLTYVSAYVCRVTGADVTALIGKGCRIRLTDNSATKYFVVQSATFSTNTTITFVTQADYSLAGGAITVPFFSYGNPLGWPSFFNWAPTLTGFSSDPTSSYYRFTLNGSLCNFWVKQGGDGTSNATNFQLTTPVAPAGGSATSWGGFVWYAKDNGVALGVGPAWSLSQTTALISVDKAMGTAGGWTSSGAKRASFEGFYEW